MKKLFLLLLLFPVAVLAEPVNINAADAATLAKSLNGIGPKKAEAIVEYRKSHGDFKSLADVQNVPGIGEKTIQLNEKDILFGDPGAQASSSTAKTEDKSAKSPAK